MTKRCAGLNGIRLVFLKLRLLLFFFRYVRPLAKRRLATGRSRPNSSSTNWRDASMPVAVPSLFEISWNAGDVTGIPAERARRLLDEWQVLDDSEKETLFPAIAGVIALAETHGVDAATSDADVSETVYVMY